MGGITFGPKALADRLTDAAGTHAGLALTLEELCDQLSGSGYADQVLAGESGPVRLRSEEYEEVFYQLLHRVGYLAEPYQGVMHALITHSFYYRERGEEDTYIAVVNLLNSAVMDQVSNPSTGPIDLTLAVVQCYRKFGKKGYDIALERIDLMEQGRKLDPHGFRPSEWNATLALNGLFKGTDAEPEKGRFIDQRYINFLANNQDRLGDMHWRKFEQLTAEYFDREGFKVELGPGTDDDGVDVRVWRPDAEPHDSPLCIAQCKRVKQKVEKVIVKGLYADVLHEKADYGVIVTTSELSPGTKTTISARGYPIRAVERDGVAKWLVNLRVPGTGLLRWD